MFSRKPYQLEHIKKDEPFLFAVRVGDFEKVKNMVANGANIHAKNILGFSALMLAGNIGRVDIMEYLYQKGATVEAKAFCDYLAIELPIRYGYSKAIQFYIKHGIDLNLTGELKQTALHVAVEANIKNKAEILELLFSNGAEASCNLANIDALTPLMLTIVKEDRKTFDWFIEKNIELDFKNQNGHDAFAIAQLHQQKDICTILENQLSENSLNIIRLTLSMTRL